MSIEGLSVATGFTNGEILDFIRTHTMYEIASKLSLEAKTKKIVLNPRQFNISTLERVIGSPKMRQFLGISFDKEGGIEGSIPAKEFKNAYTQIVHDIATVECPAFFVPVLMRETGHKGADHGQRKEAYA